MITTILAILLIIRTFFLVIAGTFFLIGAGLGWYELRKGGMNGLTDCLIKFSVATGLVFIVSSVAVVAESIRLLFGSLIAEYITVVFLFVSIFALIMMMYTGFHLAMDLLINARSVPQNKRQITK